MKCLIFNNDEVIDYIIKYALKRSNRYEVYYPKGEYEEDNPLFNHKKFFVNDAEKVTSWEGMKDSEVISGRLCDCSKKLIYTAEKSFEKNYVDMQVSGNKILLYSNNQMLIFSKRGKKIYDGKIKDIPIKILKSKGYNKYKIITNDSILEIRLKLW